jgi:hypothetical protein
MNPAVERLFNSLTQEADLKNLVAEKREEDLYLEFKQKFDRRNDHLDERDREAFSQALSGFANADGGLLIFGIETKKDKDGVDRASSLKEIVGFSKFRSRLMDSIVTATQPFVDSVRIEAVPAAEESKGYVKCLIPQSDKVPHRAMRSGRQYWRRIATGFREMDHYELEEVFGRRLRPSLRMRVELKALAESEPLEEILFLVLNEGRGAARHFGMHCALEGALLRGVRDGIKNVTHINERRPTVQFYDPLSVIHANGIYRLLGSAVIKRVSELMPIALNLVWYAENAETRRFNVTPVPGQPNEVPPLQPVTL